MSRTLSSLEFFCSILTKSTTERSTLLTSFCQPFSSSAAKCDALKRLPNVYSFYISENKEKILSQLPPNHKRNVFMKHCAKMWNALSSTEKENYSSKLRELSNKQSLLREKMLSLQRRPPSVQQLFALSVNRTDENFFKNFANCRGLWKELSDGEKQKFELEAERLRAEHEAKVDALSEEERSALKGFSAARKTMKQFKKLVSKFGRPKKPMTPYLQFLSSVCPDGTITQRAKIFGTKWKGLADAEKQPFYDRWTLEKQNYKSDLKAWETKMMAKGESVLFAFKQVKAEKPLSPKVELEKLAEKYGKPKLPPLSAYLLFTSTLPLMNINQRRQFASEKWGLMTEAERKPFHEETSAALKKYVADLELWRKKMSESGFGAILAQLDARPVSNRRKSTDAKQASTVDEPTLIVQSATATG